MEDVMLFFDNIYFLILFTLPAAANVFFNAHVRFTPVVSKDKSVELADCVLFCFAVLFINILFMKNDILKFGEYVLLDEVKRDLFCKNNNFDYMAFIMRYFVVNLLSTIGVLFLWHLPVQWICRKFNNVLNGLFNRDKELKYSDVWTNLFETKEIIDISQCVLKIERSGHIVTAGLIRIYPGPTAGKRELALYNTDSIKELFEEDKEKVVSEKIFPFAEVEYYDVETDTLIKFYKNDKYEEYYKA